MMSLDSSKNIFGGEELESSFGSYQAIYDIFSQLLPGNDARNACWRFLCPIRIDILQAHRITAVALHLGVFQGIVFYLREGLW